MHDPEAFGVLMRRYEPRLTRYVRRISSATTEECEDLLQESFVKAYQNLNNFDRGLSFSSWMYRITHNVVISAWRKDQVRPQGNSVNVEETFLANIVKAPGDVNDDLDREQLQQTVAEVLSAMDEKYRSVLVLKYLEDKEYREISDILKKPMGTIATLLNRAKKQFRQECEMNDVIIELH